jgi:hypothetical protein
MQFTDEQQREFRVHKEAGGLEIMGRGFSKGRFREVCHDVAEW